MDPIHIKESQKGSLRKATHTKRNEKIPMAKLLAEKHSKSAAMRKKATFAINARGWNHESEK